MKYSSLFVFVAGFFTIASCKKEKGVESTTPPVTNVSQADKIKDSVLLFAKDLYLWYNQIPSTFNARSYADPDKIMEATRQFSKETGFNTPVDKWSFAYKQAQWDDVSAGISKDFGINIFFNAPGDLRVKAVEKKSPAGIAGIHRGWRIIKINGNTDMTTSNTDFIVKNVYSSNTASFTFSKPDGTTADLTLTSGTYDEHPIYLDTVFTVGSKKVGYLVFNSFLGDTSAIYNDFQRIFSRFAQSQVNEMVVDLRYNGGGYVSVQEKLANYLITNAGNGGVMMNQQFNDKYAQWNETTTFSKKGSVNVPRILFIVSHSTASASELLINNLKPYMDVKLVGPGSTYGKPVGFFPIPVGDWYVFPVSFRTTNKNGEGSYFNGLALDKQVADGLDKDWGDRTENSLASALKYIETGSFSFTPPGETIGSSNNAAYKQQAVLEGNRQLDAPAFKGTVSTRKLYR